MVVERLGKVKKTNLVNFNQPYLSGKELSYIEDAVKRLHLSGNGYYSQKCQRFFEQRFGFRKCLLTTSCTDALEMCALLLDLKQGDEVIMPTFTFVSTANAFALRGAKIVFVDSEEQFPNMNAAQVEALITPRTKAIVAVHYAGVACNLEALKLICVKHGLSLIEDAAQAIDVPYGDSFLGGIGDLATFSFHETKNIQCGEGGMLVINNVKYVDRAEILWEKGTNRQAFFKGQVDKYRWVDLGSSFLPSELNAAYLWAQLECIDEIIANRKSLWQHYFDGLLELDMQGSLSIQKEKNCGNGHIFYVVTNDAAQRIDLIEHLRSKNINAVFHYQALHKSPFYTQQTKNSFLLANAEHFEDCLLRLPLFMELTSEMQAEVIHAIKEFYS